jgi:DNA-binding response OmpR family regulator
LKKEGYEIITAVNSRDAFNLIENEKPDLVLLDLIMPTIFGTELCKRVKNDEKLKHISIILFTAHDDIMTAEKAESMGADDYITKPFDAKELVNKTERLLTERAVKS